MSAPARSTAPRRPGGRSARVQSAVYTAVGELVSEGYRETMTIPQVAERAGVNPTSIYRRWGVMDALLEEVAVAALTKNEPLPDTGSIAGDLRAWATVIVDDITRPERTTYLRAMVGARKEIGTCPCWDTRDAQLQSMIERARSRGEKVPSARRALDHIVAPLYHHVVFGLPADRAYADRLVEDVLAMGEA
ncbi:TetR/AcrR family transcriptional regulator [Williamsia muralis]|uniref:TetR family transcriptional regulator n=1 Tax=Williamsia marianensis TaxID=85044 RepID=A0A495K6Y1_WILMA|nr:MULTISPECIES: TetR/AcrR family transcriptional regulator [Williamsia]RKR97057.1 TetR family transcriptional regulator [Williamsia muralis]